MAVEKIRPGMGIALEEGTLKKRTKLFGLLLLCSVFLCGCGGLKINVGCGGAEDPLKEYVVQGKEEDKILMIPIRGFISDSPKRHFLGERPGVVQEVVARLRKAEEDENVRALILEIDSAGGSTTAGDILYHEIMAFKDRKRVKIVAVFLDIAASGGYYVALPADLIIAHPTSITGSIGVVIITPKVAGLMDKIGVAVDVNKSGKEKDMGSPFRASTPEERRIFQEITDKMARRFLDLTARHRRLNERTVESLSSARIYLSDEALRLGLVDRIGYMDDAVSAAKELAGLSQNAKVVVYRRTKYANDNLYNTSLSCQQALGLSVPDGAATFGPGFHYLWLPGIELD